MKLKARIVLEFTYDADPEHYGTSIPSEMADVDKENFEDPLILSDMITGDTYDIATTVEVTPVKN